MIFRYFTPLVFIFLSSVIHAQNIGKKISINPYQYTSPKEVIGTHGAIACAHPLAAKVGLDILEQGGNAVDASIAVQYALAVVYPRAGNIGGGGFLVLRQQNGKTTTLDYRETAPAKATENMYVDKKTGKANTRLSQNGHLAVGVPGTVAGLFASAKWGKLPMKLLIQPAIDLAEKGFAITEREAKGLNDNQTNFDRNNTTLPVFCRKSGWKAGDTLVQKDLARTLIRIRDLGQKGFYEGETARLIVNEMERGDGIISLTDLKTYQAKERTALDFTYKGYEIITMPPPSSGGVLLEQMMKILENRSLPQYGFQTAKSVQLMTEVERRAYADRAEHLGDPDFYKVPLVSMVKPDYLSQRMADYDSTKATPSTTIKAGIPKESMETTHISIIDKAGNCVSVTTTLNGNYGSKTVVGGAGFLLNNEMDDFSAQPGVPNMFGAIGGAANAIAPGKRMLSSMTPTIVLKNGKPFMIVGTPGGTTIITSVLQNILNVVDFGMGASEAINQPKFHHQWQPDEVSVEKDFPTAVRKQLEAMGYKIVEKGSWSASEIILIHADGSFTAAADKRSDDAVAGW